MRHHRGTSARAELIAELAAAFEREAQADGFRAWKLYIVAGIVIDRHRHPCAAQYLAHPSNYPLALDTASGRAEYAILVARVAIDAHVRAGLPFTYQGEDLTSGRTDRATRASVAAVLR